MKATQSRNVAMSDLFRAIAGDAQAQFDMIACTVYSAAYSIMQAGNKTQFNKLEQDAQMYGADTQEANKLVREFFGVKTLNAQCKHFKKVYFSLAATLAAFPAPAMLKDLPKDKAAQHAILDPLASDYADQFTMNFTTIMTTPARTAEEQAAADAEREAKKAEKAKAQAKAEKQSKAELEQKIRSEISAATVMTPEDVIIAAIDVIKGGMVSAELAQALRVALDIRATDEALASAGAVAQPEAA